MKTRLASFVLLAGLLFSRAAAAEPVSKSTWYGWQTLAVDGSVVAASATLLGATTALYPGQRDAARAMAVTSLTTLGVGYALGGPLVHVLHGRVARGATSFVLRVGCAASGALVGGLVGREMQSNEAFDFSTLTGAVVGTLVGAGTAIAVDAAVDARAPLASPKIGWTPDVRFDPKRQSLLVGLSTTF